METKKSFKIGVVLGGGGTRGFAHLGVLKVLEDEKIPIDLVCGTSFGSLVGGLYATEPDANLIKEKIIRFLKSPVFKHARLEFLKENFTQVKKSSFFDQMKSYFKRGLFYGISLNRGFFISAGELQRTLNGLIEDIKIEDTKIPFFCVAADILSGMEIVLSTGPMREAVAASCAIPGIFPPVKIGNMQLIDGGWVNRVPIEPALRNGATFTIAIEASNNLEPSELKRGIEIVLRSSDMTRNVLSEIQLRQADVVIRPDVGHIHWAEFNRGAECYKAGEEAAKKMIDSIKREIRNKRLRQFLLGKRSPASLSEPQEKPESYLKKIKEMNEETA
ncbi:MAG: patatin-like phospholipase family protein [Nitrospirae bacterium]|nr:patatin-like phospholipase family protein [Nitrospirota bacterium]MBI3594821.1 patatin-like phospholipase family protein [Nitrospirota bacterium]